MFCIQRIRRVEDLAHSEGRPVRDGEVTPACAQACPAYAITFGRLDDPESRVSKLAKDGRAYRMLEELGTQPRITYLREIQTMATMAELIPLPDVSTGEQGDPRDHLMLDPRPRGEMNAMVMESMHKTSKKFWGVVIFLVLTVAFALVGAWGYMIAEGMGVTGLTRPIYWGIFITNTVFWIGISHAGTFISAFCG